MSSSSSNNVDDDAWLMQMELIREDAEGAMMEEDEGDSLEENLLLSYKPLHFEAQQRLQEGGCVVDIKLFSGAVAGEVSA